MRKGCVLISVLLVLALLCGAAGAESAVSGIIDGRTTQSFTDEAVPEDDLRAIVEAGLAATSAINQQPWYFAVVTNREVMDEIKGSAGGFGGAPMGGRPEGGAPDGAPTGDKPEGGFGGTPTGDKPEGEMPAPPQGGEAHGFLQANVANKAGNIHSRQGT